MSSLRQFTVDKNLPLVLRVGFKETRWATWEHFKTWSLDMSRYRDRREGDLTVSSPRIPARMWFDANSVCESTWHKCVKSILHLVIESPGITEARALDCYSLVVYISNDALY